MRSRSSDRTDGGTTADLAARRVRHAGQETRFSAAGTKRLILPDLPPSRRCNPNSRCNDGIGLGTVADRNFVEFGITVIAVNGYDSTDHPR